MRPWAGSQFCAENPVSYCIGGTSYFKAFNVCFLYFIMPQRLTYLDIRLVGDVTGGSFPHSSPEGGSLLGRPLWELVCIGDVLPLVRVGVLRANGLTNTEKINNCFMRVGTDREGSAVLFCILMLLIYFSNVTNC